MIPLVLLAVFAVEIERAGVEHAGALYAEQIFAESSWRPDVCSPADACGLAQFTPPTRGDIFPATSPSCEGEPATNPVCSIRAMILYDQRLLRANKGANRPQDRWALALSGYNGGQGWVNRESRKCAGIAGCRPGKWARHVQRVCLRAEWACEENKAYPGRIMGRVTARLGGRSRATVRAGGGGWEAVLTIGG